MTTGVGVRLPGFNPATGFSDTDFVFMTQNGATVKGTIAQLRTALSTNATLETFLAGPSFTGSIAGALLTVSVFASGAPLAVGQTVFGAGVNTGQTILSLGTGTGGTGTYNLSASQATVTSEAMGAASEAQFAPGFSTNITLDGTYGSVNNILVAFDTGPQFDCTLNGLVLGFNPIVPAGVQAVNILGGTARTIGVTADASVTDAKVAPGSKLYNRVNDVIDVRDPAFGALGNPALDTVAFQAAANAAGTTGASVLVPPGKWNIGTVTSANPIVWITDGATDPFGNPLVLPGVARGLFGADRYMFNQNVSSGSDFAMVNPMRHANHTGGTPGNTTGTLRADLTVDAGVTNFEWALMGILRNYATGGENVGGYLQGWKMTAATGPTWGSVSEGRDMSGAADPVAGLLGIEVDVFANGSDANNRRIGVDVVTGKGLPGGAGSTAYAGIRIGPSNGIVADANFNNGIVLTGAFVQTGINFTGATFPTGGPAIGLAASQYIAFESTNQRNLQYAAAIGLRYIVQGTIFFGIADSGTPTFGNFTAGALTPTGYITITDIAGVTRRLLVG